MLANLVVWGLVLLVPSAFGAPASFASKYENNTYFGATRIQAGPTLGYLEPHGYASEVNVSSTCRLFFRVA